MRYRARRGFFATIFATQLEKTGWYGGVSTQLQHSNKFNKINRSGTRSNLEQRQQANSKTGVEEVAEIFAFER
jgi:hypothetical protein